MGVQSVDRALSLLEAISLRSRGLAEVAQTTGLPLSTAARLLGALEERGAVFRDYRGLYEIGEFTRRVAGGQGSATSIQDAAHLELTQLSTDLDEAACLSVPIGQQTLTIVQVDVPRPVRAEDWTGHRWAITGGGSGVVMMATWPSSRVEALLSPLPDVDQGTVRNDVEQARRRGVSWSHGTHVDELSSVAAAVVDRSASAVAAVVAYGPSYRFPPRGQTAVVEQMVADAAASVSRNLVR